MSGQTFLTALLELRIQRFPIQHHFYILLRFKIQCKIIKIVIFNYLYPQITISKSHIPEGGQKSFPTYFSPHGQKRQGGGGIVLSSSVPKKNHSLCKKEGVFIYSPCTVCIKLILCVQINLSNGHCTNKGRFSFLDSVTNVHEFYV